MTDERQDHRIEGAKDVDANAHAPDVEDKSSIGEIIDCLADVDQDGTVSVGAVVEALGRTSFGPLLLIPALVVITPLSAIPGVSSVGGIIIALVAIQMAFGRDHVWLPNWVMRRGVERKRFERALATLKTPAGWIDRATKRRLPVLVERPVAILPETLCVLSGAAMPFLELIPMTSTLLAAGVVFFAVALVTQDGLVAIFGFAMLAVAVGAIGYFISQGAALIGA